jgi:hypothetical protein
MSDRDVFKYINNNINDTILYIRCKAQRYASDKIKAFVFNITEDDPLYFFMSLIIYYKNTYNLDQEKMRKIFDSGILWIFDPPRRTFTNIYNKNMTYENVYDSMDDFVNDKEHDNFNNYMVFVTDAKYIVFSFFPFNIPRNRNTIFFTFKCCFVNVTSSLITNISLLNIMYIIRHNILHKLQKNVHVYLADIKNYIDPIFDDLMKGFLDNVRELDFSLDSLAKLKLIELDYIQPAYRILLFDIEINDKHYWVNLLIYKQSEKQYTFKLQPIYNVLQIVSLKKEDYTPDKKSKRKLEYFRERFAIDFAYIREIINKIYDKYENVQYKITSSSHNGSRHVITVSVVKSDILVPNVSITLKYTPKKTLFAFTIDTLVNIKYSPLKHTFYNKNMFYMPAVDSEKCDIACDIAYQLIKVFKSKKFRNKLASTSRKYSLNVKFSKRHEELNKLIKERKLSLENFIVRGRYEYVDSNVY